MHIALVIAAAVAYMLQAGVGGCNDCEDRRYCTNCPDNCYYRIGTGCVCR
uniref:Uncharacterized protein n=1 Tax=Perkinsus marinus TaxID=31276 RepID=C9VXM5_9ALVE|nr:unknown protein [Perkinsus marinus]